MTVAGNNRQTDIWMFTIICKDFCILDLAVKQEF